MDDLSPKDRTRLERILAALDDRRKSLLIDLSSVSYADGSNGMTTTNPGQAIVAGDPIWVNHKPGPALSFRLFKLALDRGYIAPCNRARQNGSGGWFAITPKGRAAIPDMFSLQA